MQNNKNITKHLNKKIVIGLCTFHRNHSLDSALESLSRINLPEDVNVEFILVDNDKNGGAQKVFQYYQDILPFKSHYFIEYHQGVVHARNRVIEEALKLEATEIASFDDDEILSPQWLTALWNFYKKSFCAGVGGPMYRLLPPDTNQILLRFWKNFQRYNTGDSLAIISTNNCLFSTDLVHPNKMNLRFDEFFNQIGGEDAKFAIDAIRCGARFGFVQEAISIERFSKQRATFRYLLKRQFGSGSLLPLILRRLYQKKYLSYLLPNIIKLVAHIVFIPFSILFGRYQFWNNLVKLSKAAGTIIGCFGKSYKHYTLKNILLENLES